MDDRNKYRRLRTACISYYMGYSYRNDDSIIQGILGILLSQRIQMSNKERNIRVSQNVWKDLKILAIEYEMPMTKVIEVLLNKMRGESK